MTARYPKSEKFVLAAKTQNAALARANLALEKTRIWVRLGFELRFMNLKQYECGSRMNDEVGRLLGGLRKRFGGAVPDMAASPNG